MKSNLLIYVILLSVICILSTLLQYYWKSVTRIKKPDPFFIDFILSSSTTKEVIRYHQIKPMTEQKGTSFTNSEIEQCLKAADSYRASGKLNKAIKLFKYAATIAPNDPDVLNKYGEVLEEYDIINADELYFKALTISPEHIGALQNRKRTKNLVDQLDHTMLERIDVKRDILRATLNKTINFDILKSAFYLHIYHSVGIEGNTMTLSELQYLLETGRAVHGKSLLEHNEILGLELALQYVKLISKKMFISVNDILKIHKRVMGYVDPIQSGMFRTEQVFVGKHVPPPPNQLNQLMEDYIDWLNSDEAENMHPLRLAALAHYKLVEIHPFTDGNGRTSRLIMNLILLKSGYPPVIIYKEDRQKYYEYLNLANKGDLRPFVRFIAYCTDETLNTYLGLNKQLVDGLEVKDNNRSLIINY